MRAVNLIPAEQRKGAGGAAGRAGGAVYVLVGGLVALVMLSVVYAVAATQVSDRQSKLGRVSTQADVTQAQATSLQPYVTFASIRQSREQAVATITASRFDWAASMDQIARSLPHDVTLSAVTGAQPAASAAAPLAGGPSITLTGCAVTHSEVANVLVDLHRIIGVTGVSLATSTKASGAVSTPTVCPGATFAATLGYGANSTIAAHTTTPQGATAPTATSPTAGSLR